MEQKRLFKEQLLLTAMDLKKLLNKIWMVPIRKLTMFWEVPKNRSQRFNRIFQGTISAEEKPVALRATLLLILNHQTQPLLQQKEHLEAGLVEPQIQLIKPIQLLVLLLVQLGIHTEATVVTGHHQPQGHLTKPTTGSTGTTGYKIPNDAYANVKRAYSGGTKVYYADGT